jgi:transposase
MASLSIEEFYGQSIGVKAPWKVSSVEIKGELKEVHILVECPEGIAWVDPETKQRAEIKDWQQRVWRHLDTCEYETIITARVPRLKLKSGRTMMVSVPWAEPGGRFTCSFESHLINLLTKCRTVKAAAQLGGVTDDQMDGVMARAVARGVARREAVSPRVAGFDEKAVRKGHRYITLLNDLDLGRVIDVVEGRTQQAAETLLDTLTEHQRQGIEAVAMDMWPAYMAAVNNKLPQASHVFDRFHVAKHLNEAVDKVRRKENRELSALGDDTLKRTKYLWLRSRLDLRTKVGIEFRQLLNDDLQTATAWGLKENFNHFWSYQSWAHAVGFLDKWVEAVRETELKPMEQVAEMIEKHAEGLLNYIHHRITNAASEGMNSAIQSLKHAAKGLVNFKSLRARILFFLGKLDMLPC